MPSISLLFSDPLSRKLILQLLASEGYSVQDDHDALSVLTWLGTISQPAIVLFGDYLPGMRAEAFLAQLLHEPGLMKQHGFLFLSTEAHAFSLAQISLIRQLALPVVSLPFTRAALFATLSAVQRRIALP